MASVFNLIMVGARGFEPPTPVHPMHVRYQAALRRRTRIIVDYHPFVKH